MNILLLSDLHLEHHEDRSTFSDSLNIDCDVLVLAGDIDKHDKIAGTLDSFSKKFSCPIVYVPGNHEYYFSDPISVHADLDEVSSRHDNLHILRAGNRSVEINGRRFHGSTGWFRDDPLNFHYEQNMGDFQAIQCFKPWVYQEQGDFQRHLVRELAQGDVVVTHHLPSDLCVADCWKGSLLNRFFTCDYTEFMMDRKPALWMYGHTHEASDQVIGDTRVVCNPRGYPDEHRSLLAFNQNIEITV